MAIVIAREPEETEIPITQLWNGESCPDDRLSARVFLCATKEGLRVKAESPVLHDQKIPDAPKGTRVERLWESDVVEVFFVGPGHRYLEVELGAGGHWLVLGFDSIRHRMNDYEKFNPLFRFWKTDHKTWVSQIIIPWEYIPENLRAMNAFMIASGKFLAFAPVPGEKPDFHQPDTYPSVRLS